MHEAAYLKRVTQWYVGAGEVPEIECFFYAPKTASVSSRSRLAEAPGAEPQTAIQR